jgi:hypothetical protein
MRRRSASLCYQFASPVRFVGRKHPWANYLPKKSQPMPMSAAMRSTTTTTMSSHVRTRYSRWVTLPRVSHSAPYRRDTPSRYCGQCHELSGIDGDRYPLPSSLTGCANSRGIHATRLNVYDVRLSLRPPRRGYVFVHEGYLRQACPRYANRRWVRFPKSL